MPVGRLVVIDEVLGGDSAAQGLIVEVKPPLAKVQRTTGDQVAEVWVPIKALRPAAKPGEGG